MILAKNQLLQSPEVISLSQERSSSCIHNSLVEGLYRGATEIYFYNTGVKTDSKVCSSMLDIVIEPLNDTFSTRFSTGT